MQCLNCGKPITAQMISCSFCGAMLHPPATPASADTMANPYAVNPHGDQFAYANPYTPGVQPSWMPPMAPQQPASKRLGVRWAIALSVVLLILLVLVGGSVLAYTLITRPYVQKAQALDQAHSTATAVVNQ